MKRTLLSIIIAAFVATVSLSAQFGGDLFTAHEGWDAIKDSIGDYNLVMVLAAQSIESPTIVDLENGTSDGWLYFVRNIQDTTQNFLIMVMKDSDDWFWFPISENIELTDGLKDMNNIVWMDSDLMMNELKKNQIYTNYRNSNNDLYSIMIVLVYYPYDMGDDMPPQYYHKYNWMVEINEELRCVVNSETGEMDCEVLVSDVDENIVNNELKVFPQPANDVINIEGINIYSIEVFNLFGQMVYQSSIENSLNISIPTKGLETGTYIIKMLTQTGVQTRKIQVIK